MSDELASLEAVKPPDIDGLYATDDGAIGPAQVLGEAVGERIAAASPIPTAESMAWTEWNDGNSAQIPNGATSGACLIPQRPQVNSFIEIEIIAVSININGGASAVIYRTAQPGSLSPDEGAVVDVMPAFSGTNPTRASIRYTKPLRLRDGEQLLVVVFAPGAAGVVAGVHAEGLQTVMRSKR